jgi:hypothetical protein
MKEENRFNRKAKTDKHFWEAQSAEECKENAFIAT